MQPGPKTPKSKALAFVVVLAALAETIAAFVGFTLSAKGICLAVGGPFGCAALVRPRLGALVGPITVSHLALGGALLTLVLAFAWLVAGLRGTAARATAAVVAGGAGLALGLQALPAAAGAAACPVCLGIALSAVVTAGLFALLANKNAEVHWREPLIAFLAVLLCALPLAVGRGFSIGDEDERRKLALEEAGGEQGPTLLLVVRDGCVYCEAMRLDVLSEPEVLALIEKTRGLEEIREHDPRAKQYAGGHGAPVLIGLGAKGQLVDPLRGLHSVADVRRWLVEAIGAP